MSLLRKYSIIVWKNAYLTTSMFVEERKEIILLAIQNAQAYLDQILNSQVLLDNLKFAFDYTYATAAFTVIFLLKVVTVFPKECDYNAVLASAHTVQSILQALEGKDGTYAKSLATAIVEVERSHTQLPELSDGQVDVSSFLKDGIPFEWLVSSFWSPESGH
jgi:hypothetical protein